MKDHNDINFDPSRQGKPAGPADPTALSSQEMVPGDDSAFLRYGQDELQRLMDHNFLQYASYVIRDRAIPNLEDGLKPVQRRILYALFEKDDSRFIKVANIVGHSMQYHPHGDASITDALTTLTNKGFLIEGQGNFGNVLTGDRPAASRYIECRLTELAKKELFNKEITKYQPSYDGRNKEPVTLPAKLPLLLMLGADGIAVGLSTRILPHNFCELLEAQIAVLSKKPFSLVPDFIQAGLMDVKEYNKGNGRIRVRARIEKKGPDKLVIKELPYSTTTESLTASIEDAIRKKKVPVKTIDDYTAEEVNIELTLTPDTKPAKAIKALYAFTNCEGTVSCHATIIHQGRPVMMDVDEILIENTHQLTKVLKQELTLKKRLLLEDIHAKTLVQIFVEHRIYKKIETCESYQAMQQAVTAGLQPFVKQLQRAVTKQDIEMLLGIRIRRISLFDNDKNSKEISTLQANLQQVEKQLENLRAYTIRYLKGLLKTYQAQHPRRTEVQSFDSIEIKELTAKELEIHYNRKKGYLGNTVKAEEIILQCSSYDKLILVWEDGRYKVVPPPERLFVDTNLIYCAKLDRKKVITMVYTEAGITYIKRFTFGGTVLNKEYRCTEKGSKILFLADDNPEEIFVKYKPAKKQRIHQQRFDISEIPVKTVKTNSFIMAPKEIEKISSKKPRWWKNNETSPPGMVLWES